MVAVASLNSNSRGKLTPQIDDSQFSNSIIPVSSTSSSSSVVLFTDEHFGFSWSCYGLFLYYVNDLASVVLD